MITVLISLFVALSGSALAPTVAAPSPSHGAVPAQRLGRAVRFDPAARSAPVGRRFCAARRTAAVRRTDAARPVAASPRAVRCRYECVCFRVNGYRCLRIYTQPCDGSACWECQKQVTRKARKSCSLGPRIKSCFCKYRKE